MEFTMMQAKLIVFSLLKKKATNMISKDYTLFGVPSILGHKAYCSLNAKADPRAKISGK